MPGSATSCILANSTLGDRLYGTAAQGGASGFGTIFWIHTNGTGFTVLHSFAFATGAYPRAGLVLHSNVLHGATSFGAAFLSGGTNAAGFVLESATNIVPAPNWTSVSPGPVIVTGQYTVTNSLAGTETHFRLRQ